MKCLNGQNYFINKECDLSAKIDFKNPENPLKGGGFWWILLKCFCQFLRAGFFSRALNTNPSAVNFDHDP